MNNFATRSITGALYGVVVLGCILFGSTSFAILGLFFTVVGLHEFFTIIQNTGLQPLRRVGVASGIILFMAFFFYTDGLLGLHYFLLFIVMFLLLLTFEMFRNKPNPFGNIAVTLLGLAYIAFPVSLLNFLVFPEKNGSYTPYLLLLTFVMIWSFDTGAYLAGITFGKHKLFPRLSPHKSWEGIAGGAVLVVIAAWIFSLFCQPVSTKGMILAALLTAVGATTGDLVESMLKRSVDIKDTGKLLPGHGGLLDRIDSLLFVGPIIYVFMEFYR